MSGLSTRALRTTVALAASTLLGAALLVTAPATPADAAGWASIHRYVKKSGRCNGGREVLATWYKVGSRTANGERFNPHGQTAASYDYAMGTTISAHNPKSGRTCAVRINDRGPHGIARRMGARIDFALGAARCLGMRSTQYVCVQ